MPAARGLPSEMSLPRCFGSTDKFLLFLPWVVVIEIILALYCTRCSDYTCISIGLFLPSIISVLISILLLEKQIPVEVAFLSCCCVHVWRNIFLKNLFVRRYNRKLCLLAPRWTLSWPREDSWCSPQESLVLKADWLTVSFGKQLFAVVARMNTIFHTLLLRQGCSVCRYSRRWRACPHTSACSLLWGRCGRSQTPYMLEKATPER